MTVHARGDVTGECLLPHAPECFMNRNTKCFMQVCIRVCIDCKNWDFRQVNKRTDQQGTDRGLSRSSFPGNGNSKRMCLHNFSCFTPAQESCPDSFGPDAVR